MELKELLDRLKLLLVKHGDRVNRFEVEVLTEDNNSAQVQCILSDIAYSEKHEHVILIGSLRGNF